MVCPALVKHGYLCQKYVMASEKVVDKFNNKFPKMTDQSQTSKPVAKRVSDELFSNQVSARRVHSPSISNSTLEYTVPQDTILNNVLLMPNQVAPIPTYNRYTNI